MKIKLDYFKIREMVPNEKGIAEWSILLAYRGSIAHNLYIPSDQPNSTDDIDLISICIPPLDYYFGLKEYGSQGTVEIKEGKLDIVIFEFKKLIKMLSGCNPNVISLLWTNGEHYIGVSPVGRELIDNRDIFLSKQVYHKFGSYAKNQLSEMKKGKKLGYMGEKRSELVAKYGYDTKNASHLIRLLRMCDEILRTKKVNVWREDRDELLAIKTGEWTLEQVQAEADRLFTLCEDAYAICELPEKVDMDKIDKLCVDLLRKFHENQ